MVGINPDWLNKLEPKQREFALTASGFKFLFQFLWRYGEHLFIFGVTGSGKTQKGYWLVNWMKHTKETIIWLDSGKNNEIVPLLQMGLPVRIICPVGTDVIFKEYDPSIKKYVKMKDHPEVIQVPEAGSAWWAVKKKYINIFCFRNAFERNGDRLVWMQDLFDTLAVWLRRSIFPKITPFSLFGDEFQWVNAGESVSGDEIRREVSEGISENAFEIRGYGGRLVIFTQLYKSIPPGTRKNLPSLIMCRDAIVDSSENPALAKFNRHVPYYKPNEGLFVFSDKKPVPATSPWRYKYFPMPKIKVQYVGEYDNPSESTKQEVEIEQEMTPDFSKYNSTLQDLVGYEVPHIINRYEVIEND